MTWEERIDAAERREYFDGDDRAAAEQWSVCALGEAFTQTHPGLMLLSPIQRSGSEGERLTRLGNLFSDVVEDNNFAEARLVLAEIRRDIGLLSVEDAVTAVTRG